MNIQVIWRTLTFLNTKSRVVVVVRRVANNAARCAAVGLRRAVLLELACQLATPDAANIQLS